MSGYPQSGQVSRSNYDRLSRWYDLLASRSERRARVAGLNLLKVNEGDTILELGPGTGQALLALARSLGDRGQVIGVDLSKGMLSQAAARLQKANLSERAALLRGDAIHLPFRSQFCDLIFMSFTLELFGPGEMAAVLGECQRVLKTGGSLGVVALSDPADPGLPVRVYTWAHRKFPGIVDCRPIPVPRILSQAGFQVQEMAGITLWGLPVQVVRATKGEGAEKGG